MASSSSPIVHIEGSDGVESMAASVASPSDVTQELAESNAARFGARKPVWSKPTNGVIDNGLIMGATSWPALSESSTRASPKPSVSPSDTPSPASQGFLIPPSSSSPNKLILNSQNANFSKGHATASRQRSFKRGPADSASGGNGESPNVGASQGSEERSAPENSPKEPLGKNGDHVLRAGMADHQRNYSMGGSGRRGTNGGNGGPQHNNLHMGRSDHDWNHRSMNVWEPRGLRPYIQPLGTTSPPLPPYMPPPPPPFPIQGQAFPPMVFQDLAAPLYYPVPEALGHIPFVAPMQPPVFIPMADPLRAALLRQIDYYFSSENLCKDVFLRKNMDNHGWVPISLIAGFKKVKLLTSSIPYILETVQFSVVVEVQGNKIRRRYDWMNWLLPPGNQFGVSYGSQSTVTQIDSLNPQFQNIDLEDEGLNEISNSNSNQKEEGLLRSSSAVSTTRSQTQSSDNYGNFAANPDSGNHSRSSRSLARSGTL